MAFFFALAFLSACAADLRNAVPAALVDKVHVKGLDQVRIWGDVPIANLDELAAKRQKQILKNRPQIAKRKNHTMYMLALSGGGSDGAFGAGFLNGWSATGKRPTFEIVSGVSTGALMAPFAFLGPAYDKQLKELYTLYSTKDLLQPQVLAGLLGGDALSSSKPLAELIARYVDRAFLAEIAREHRKGRRLLVGTTNLDQERPVIWDMGGIASKNNDRALELFRKVLLASASIPGVFPPVFIKVESGGNTFEEMHVDGGTTDNAFLLPLHIDIRKLDKKMGRSWKRRIFVIANSKTAPSPKSVKGTTLEIAGRSISTLIRQQTEGDLIKIYLRAKENKIDFNLAGIPRDFTADSKEAFDRQYMGQLFALGEKVAREGYKWKKKPPGI